MLNLDPRGKPVWVYFALCFVVASSPCLAARLESRVDAEMDSNQSRKAAQQAMDNPSFCRAFVAEQLNDRGYLTPERLDVLEKMTDDELVEMINNGDVAKLVGGDDSGAVAVLLIFFFLLLLAAAAGS